MVKANSYLVSRASSASTTIALYYIICTKIFPRNPADAHVAMSAVVLYAPETAKVFISVFLPVAHKNMVAVEVFCAVSVQMLGNLSARIHVVYLLCSFSVQVKYWPISFLFANTNVFAIFNLTHFLLDLVNVT